MKTHLLPSGAALALALFVTGCESDGGITARIQEKSAAYAALKPWDKNYVDKGVVATGFTADMVYMAVGNPTKVEAVKTSDGRNAEVWTYDHYYPSPDAAHIRYTAYNSETTPQESQFMVTSVDSLAFNNPTYGHNSNPANMIGGESWLEPIGTNGLKPGTSITGPPQGGTMEPAELQAYTLMVLFQDGKVIRLALKP